MSNEPLEPRTDAEQIEANEAEDAIAVVSPVVAACVAIQRLLTQKFGASCEDTTKIAKEIVEKCSLMVSRRYDQGQIDRDFLIIKQLGATRIELATTRVELAAAHRQLAAAHTELRAIDREARARHIEARIAEAREQERATVAAELASVRARCAQLQSENDELRACKKKLREAVERLKAAR